jgi:hypothetical protein
MTFNAASTYKWGTPIAGAAPSSQFGLGAIEPFQQTLNQRLSGYKEIEALTKDMDPATRTVVMQRWANSAFPSAEDTLVTQILAENRRANSKEEQLRQLKLADEFQTRKGWKSAMFNTLTSGLENLTKGIGMSMNPYGSMENARYIADALASSSDRMATGYAAVRNPLQIPGVNTPGAATYF